MPNCKPLFTLRDAAQFITALPKAEQDTSQWAAELLMMIAEHGGAPMMARIAMMRALHRHKPKPNSVSRRKRAKAYRIVR